MASTGISATYTLNWSNPSLKPSLVIYPGVTDTTDTSLTLYGKCAPVYGQGLEQNLILMLENFANGAPPQNPTIGQLWYNTTSQQLQVYSTNLQWVATTAVSYVYPASPLAGDMFWNPGLTALEVYDGTRWQQIAEMSYVVPEVTTITSEIEQIQQTLLTLPDQQLMQQQIALIVNDVNQLITAVHALATATNTAITLTTTLLSTAPATFTPTQTITAQFTAKGTLFSITDGTGYTWFGYVIIDASGIYAVQMTAVYQPNNAYVLYSTNMLVSNILTQSNVITWQYSYGGQVSSAIVTISGSTATLLVDGNQSFVGTLTSVPNTTALAGTITGTTQAGWFWDVPVYIDQRGNAYVGFSATYQVNTNVIFVSPVYSGVNPAGSPNISWSYTYGGVTNTATITTTNNSLSAAGGTVALQVPDGQTYTNQLLTL
jgi:hypothetical protein